MATKNEQYVKRQPDAGVKRCPTCKKKVEMKDRYEEADHVTMGYMWPCNHCQHCETQGDEIPCAFCIYRLSA